MRAGALRSFLGGSGLAELVAAADAAPPLALGPEAARDEAALAAWLAGWEGPVGIEIRDLHVEAAAGVGWSRSLNRLHGALRGGRRVDMWMRSTLSFRKVDGAWRIAHGHTSVPFHMDGSYRAAVELSPEL